MKSVLQRSTSPHPPLWSSRHVALFAIGHLWSSIILTLWKHSKVMPVLAPSPVAILPTLPSCSCALIYKRVPSAPTSWPRTHTRPVWRQRSRARWEESLQLMSRRCTAKKKHKSHGRKGNTPQVKSFFKSRAVFPRQKVGNTGTQRYC